MPKVPTNVRWDKMPFRRHKLLVTIDKNMVLLRKIVDLETADSRYHQDERIEPINYEQGRTGEPSPTSHLQEYEEKWKSYQEWSKKLSKTGLKDILAGRSRPDTYTQKMRAALIKWQELRGGILQPVSFRYRMYRHKVVTIIGNNLSIWHSPSLGAGSKGFTLQLSIISIDGLKPNHFDRMMTGSQGLAFNKIIADGEMKQVWALLENTDAEST